MMNITYPIRPTSPATTIRSDESDWTAEDWELLDHGIGTLYEIIDGVLYMSSVPSLFHQWIIAQVFRYFGIPFKDTQQGHTFSLRTSLFLPPHQIVQPDTIAICNTNQRVQLKQYAFGVPDLVLEVLSPGNADHDLKVKFEAYERAGVPEYVIIRPAERALTHFRLGSDGKYAEVGTFSGDHEVSVDLAPDIRFRVHQLFDGAPDTTL